MKGVTTSDGKAAVIGLPRTCTWCGQEALVTLFRSGTSRPVRACFICARDARKHGMYARSPKE